jgi:hypothetical protein
VVARQYVLVADVSSATPAAIEPLLRQLVDGEITPTADGFHVVATLSGERAQAERARVHFMLSRDLPVASGGTWARSELMVLGGLETAVVSAAASAYTIDAPAHARVLLARVP